MKFAYKCVIFLVVLLMSLSFVSAVNDTSTDSTSTSTITQDDVNPVDSKVLVKDEVTSTKADTNTSVKAVKITANNVKAYSGGNYTFKATVVDEDNNLVPEGKFVIKFNGKTHITTEIDNGELNYEYVMPDYSAKNYTLQYVYVQNDNYGRYELNKTLTLMKGNSTTSTNDSNVVPVTIAAGRIETCAGHIVRFNGVVLDNRRIPVSEGKIVIKLNGKTHIITQIKNNRFDYEYVMPNYSAKDYNLQYVYVQNNKYGRYELNTTLKIFDKNYGNVPYNSTSVIADDVVSYRNDLVVFKGKVIDSNNNPVNGLVHIKINERVTQQVSVINGSFQITMEVNYSPKYYLLTYVYGHRLNTALRSETNRVLQVINKVDPSKMGVVINANDINTVLGTTVPVYGNVTDVNAKTVKNGTVQVMIANTTQVLGKFSVVNGKFKGYMTVPAGKPQNCTIQYVYLQNDYYARYELNRTLSLVKQNTSIIFGEFDDMVDDFPEEDPCLVISQANGTINIPVILKGKTDGRRAATGKIGVKINGKTCCDEKGTPLITPVQIYQEFPDDPLVVDFNLPSSLKKDSVNNITFTFSGNEYLNELRYTTQFILV